MAHLNSVNHGALVIVGSGPGVGSHVAVQFVRKGFTKIILMSRDPERLGVDRVTVSSSMPEASIDVVEVDLSVTGDVRRALVQLENTLDGCPLECVLFNAGSIRETDITSLSTEDFQQDLDTTVISLYTVAQWAFPRLLRVAATPGCKSSFLITSGSIGLDPHPPLFSLSACKAAQRNLVASFSRTYGPKGVHCGLVVIAARLGEQKWNCDA